MAFNAEKFIPLSSLANSDVSRIFGYSTSDLMAVVKANGYFDDAATPTGGYGLKDDDIILVRALGAESFVQVAVSGAGVVTTSLSADFS